MKITYSTLTIEQATQQGYIETLESDVMVPDHILVYKLLDDNGELSQDGIVYVYQGGITKRLIYKCEVGNQQYDGYDQHDAALFLINNWLLPSIVPAPIKHPAIDAVFSVQNFNSLSDAMAYIRALDEHGFMFHFEDGVYNVEWNGAPFTPTLEQLAILDDNIESVYGFNWSMSRYGCPIGYALALRKKYRAEWSKPEYDDRTLVVNGTFFTVDNGYNLDEIEHIDELDIDHSFVVSGCHYITRVQ